MDKVKIHDGRLNSQTFTLKGKCVVFNTMPPSRWLLPSSAPTPFGDVLVDSTAIMDPPVQDAPTFFLGGVLDIPPTIVPLCLQQKIDQFAHLCQDPLEGNFPPMHKIQHQIQLQLGSALPNPPHYRMALAEHDELRRQNLQLLFKGFICENTYWACTCFTNSQKGRVLENVC